MFGGRQASGLREQSRLRTCSALELPLFGPVAQTHRHMCVHIYMHTYTYMYTFVSYT